MTTLVPGRCRWCGITQVVASGYTCREHLLQAQQALMTQGSAWVLTAPIVLMGTSPVLRPRRPWWQSDAAVAWGLILAPPVGVGLMWRYARWASGWKWLWTVLATVLALNLLAALGGNGSSSGTVQTARTAVTASGQATARSSAVVTTTPTLAQPEIAPLTASGAAELAALAAAGAPLPGPVVWGSLQRAGVTVGDFVAEARFTNNFDQAVAGGDFGLQFRSLFRNGTRTVDREYQLSVVGSQSLSISVFSTSAARSVVGSLPALNLKIKAGESNTLRLLVLADWAYAWVNSEYSGAVRLSANLGPGDVGARIPNSGSKLLEGFTVWGLPANAATTIVAPTPPTPPTSPTPPTPPTPPAPSGQPLTAPASLVALRAGSRVNLEWSDNSDNESTFQIERCSGVSCTTFAQIGTSGANRTGYADANVDANTSYTYRVMAANAAGSSAYSNTSTVPVLPRPSTSAPTALTATAVSSSRINLAWSDNSIDENAFQIDRCTGAACTDFTQVGLVARNVVIYYDMAVVAGTTYTYRVRATVFPSGSGSDYSSTAPATTMGAPN